MCKAWKHQSCGQALGWIWSTAARAWVPLGHPRVGPSASPGASKGSKGHLFLSSPRHRRSECHAAEKEIPWDVKRRLAKHRAARLPPEPAPRRGAPGARLRRRSPLFTLRRTLLRCRARSWCGDRAGAPPRAFLLRRVAAVVRASSVPTGFGSLTRCGRGSLSPGRRGGDAVPLCLACCWGRSSLPRTRHSLLSRSRALSRSPLAKPGASVCVCVSDPRQAHAVPPFEGAPLVQRGLRSTNTAFIPCC